MADYRGNPELQPEECWLHPDRRLLPLPDGRLSYTSRCPNLKETGGGFEGERYECEVCGESFFLDYEDMK